MADILSRLKTLGFYEANGLKKMGSENGKFIFYTDPEIVCDVNTNLNSNIEFEIKGTKYPIYEKDTDDLHSHSKHKYPVHLDMKKVKELQQNDTHITDIATNCKSMKWDRTLCFLDNYGTI